MDLALDTSTNSLSITIGNDKKYLTYKSKRIKRGNLHLIRGFKLLLKELKISLKDIKNFYFTIGPGSFTGIRTGLAFLYGLKEGRDVKIYPISTLEALSLSKEGTSTVVLPQSMGFWYFGIFNVKDKIKTIRKIEVIKSEEIEKKRKGEILTLKGVKINFKYVIKVDKPLSELIFFKRKILKEKKFPIAPLYLKIPYGN